MISAAQLAIDRAQHGLDVKAEVALLPAWQWDDRWPDLAPLCGASLPVHHEPHRNAWRIEVPQANPRCLYRSPDGRGADWLNSGGSPLAYGRCERSKCYRVARQALEGR